jgi:hypothetical protein
MVNILIAQDKVAGYLSKFYLYQHRVAIIDKSEATKQKCLFAYDIISWIVGPFTGEEKVAEDKDV